MTVHPYTPTPPASERGGVMLEFALVIPIFIALILGGTTTAMAYNVNNTLNNGAREAARFAATSPIDSDMGTWLNMIADVARNAAAGQLDPSDSGQRLCVAYVHPAGTKANDRTTALFESAGGRTVVSDTMCFADGRPGGEARIQVQLQRTATVNAVGFKMDLDLAATSVVRYERTS